MSQESRAVATVKESGTVLVLMQSECWACGQWMEKRVPRRHLDHQFLAWSCSDCDVSWYGPGAA